MITESEYLAAKQIVLIYEKEHDKTLYWNLLVEEWFRFCKEEFGEEPNFTNGEQPALKRLMKKIKKKADAAKIEWSPDSAVSSLHIFLKVAIKNDFVKKNFQLKIIDSKFDPLYYAAKSSNPAQKQRDLSAKLDEKIAARFGTQEHQ